MSLPYAPTKVRVIDADGYLSREWHMFFDMLYSRVGGSTAPTNNQLLQAVDSLSITSQVSPQFVDEHASVDEPMVIPGPQGPQGLTGPQGPQGPATHFIMDTSDVDAANEALTYAGAWMAKP
jgi:hypothetical protein